MKSTVYTIFKNNIDSLETWLHYTEQFDYRVILDLGSTDGTYEQVQKINDSNLISCQKLISDEEANDYILTLVPEDTDFIFQINSYEWFQLGTDERAKHLFYHNPTVNTIGCTRLDLNSYNVWNGPPNTEPHYRIHRYKSTNNKSIFTDLIFIINNENCSIHNTEK